MGRACSTMGDGRVAYRVLVGKPERKNRLEGPGVDGRIITKWTFRTWAWSGLIWLGIGTGSWLL